MTAHANGNGYDYLEDALIAGAAAGLGGLVVAYGASATVPSLSLLYGAFLAFLGAFLGSVMAARRRKHGPPDA